MLARCWPLSGWVCGRVSDCLEASRTGGCRVTSGNGDRSKTLTNPDPWVSNGAILPGPAPSGEEFPTVPYGLGQHPREPIDCPEWYSSHHFELPAEILGAAILCIAGRRTLLYFRREECQLV